MLAEFLHLKWVYEPIDQPLGQDEQDIELPSQACLEALLDFAQKGLIQSLRVYLEELVVSEPRYLNFAEQILKLAKQFKAEEIEDLLQQYIAKMAVYC